MAYVDINNTLDQLTNLVFQNKWREEELAEDARQFDENLAENRSQFDDTHGLNQKYFNKAAELQDRDMAERKTYDKFFATNMSNELKQQTYQGKIQSPEGREKVRKHLLGDSDTGWLDKANLWWGGGRGKKAQALISDAINKGRPDPMIPDFTGGAYNPQIADYVNRNLSDEMRQINPNEDLNLLRMIYQGRRP